MSAQHMPGPWKPVSLLRKPGEPKAKLMVRRLVWDGDTPRSEYLNGDDDKAMLFDTLDLARAAIAKATESVPSEADWASFEQWVERDKKDAARWRMLPAFLEKYQINYVALLSEIDEAIGSAS